MYVCITYSCVQVAQGIKSAREQQGQRMVMEDCKREDGYASAPVSQHGEQAVHTYIKKP